MSTADGTTTSERAPTSSDDAEADDAGEIRRISLRSLLDMLGWPEVDIVMLDIEGNEFTVLADVETVGRARVVVGEVHLDRAPLGFAGVHDLLPGFVVDIKSRGADNAIFRAVRRDCARERAT